MRRAFAAVALVLTALAAVAAQSAIVTVATVRQRASWTPSENRVQLRAVVTLSDPARGLLFVQDATGGLFVTLAAPAAALASGDQVDLSGSVIMTGRGPTLSDATAVRSGRAAAPAPQPLS